MFSLLTEYSFWTVALGTCLLAFASSMVGTISVLTKQSMIGDSLGHAAYPGVVFSFILFQSRNPLLLMLGSVLSGYLSYALVQWVNKNSRHSLINILALVSASFFGLGMVLKNYIQGNAHYSRASQAGLATYLFGQAAFIQKDDILLICVVAVICLGLFFVCYQGFKLYLFDARFAELVGVRVTFLKRLTMFLMICLISVGLKVVGAVLMSSFLIAPAVFGLLLGRNYRRVLLLSSVSAVISAFLGTWVSSAVSGLSTGPSIIVCMTFVTLLAFFYVTYVRKENTRV
ncbi:manganese/zinc/iron transport system permease protein [Streptococcus gallinaceus]|uniref:metal ABC transporter permease n=1 Tax=Streptococcus gallinaceus TaxID=165758 RepID=UPI00209F346B|nr:metal ABC transporter permease [Streptococcus gallinaceus]MCP1639531.1 manganese/zinc/iron transport system permease protein [Streptococcus gallinaceus]MCP1770314.1 manganese/zinc/iron transport system permease protein [Streptococcus gallinaceus]